MTEGRLFTANRFVAIPDILKSNGGILDISFVYKLHRSVIELFGTENEPFLEPIVTIEGEQVDASQAEWRWEQYWIPSYSLTEKKIAVNSRIFPALAHRGFIWTLDLSSNSDTSTNIDVGWRGQWVDTHHVISVSKPMKGERIGSINSSDGGTPFVEFRGVTPLFAVAFCPSEEMITSISVNDRVITTPGQDEIGAKDNEPIRYKLTLPITLGPHEQKTIALYVGLGLEEISAVASAVDLKRHSWQELYADMLQWLESHKQSVGDEQLDKVLNLNSFYNFYFSEGFTLDTEELVLITARSSKYHISAAYRDRDAMLWSLPAVLQIEPIQARRMLEYALTVQLRNVGVHSRFIDGVVLEPGFELDELCAPIRALALYVRSTRDMSILFDRRVQVGINRIRKILASKKHPAVALLETMLLPSNDVARCPYVTYDNVLVWRSLRDLEWMYELIHDLDRSEEHKQLARQVHKAIMDNCIVDGPYGSMFAWAVDLQGNCQIYDDPAGSLQLLSWLEFCSPDLPEYQNTVKWIYSSENPHSFHSAPFAAPGSECGKHPSILSVANSLLAGRTEQSIDFLRRVRMDDGIACETVDENTGIVASGPTFAACAGYLAFALSTALGGKVLGPEPEPSERLYEPPPAELHESMEASRLH
jgi:hypothetical protein